MADLQIFKNESFGEIRTVMVEGEPWFVGKDVAQSLGYTDLRHSILDHVDSADRVNSKTQGQNDPEFGQRGTWLINENGLYSLILSSKLPAAKEFKHWVTSEVLPALRKTGGYVGDSDPGSNDNIDETFFTDFSKAHANIFVKQHIQKFSYLIQEKNEIDTTRYFVKSHEIMKEVLRKEGIFNKDFIEQIVVQSKEYQKENKKYVLFSKAE